MTIEENNDVNASNVWIMLCLDKKFLKEQKNASLCLAIIPKRVQEIEKLNSVPLDIQPLLNEFKEIMVDDLPIGLPPLRSIYIILT